MYSRLFILFTIAATLCCCKKQSDTTTLTNDTYEKCFLKVTGNDSLYIRLSFNAQHVQGVMNWLPHEKDKMTGTLDGTLNGDQIIAIYQYSAEGITAREEKVFRLKEHSLSVKSGELEEKDGVWTLKNREDAPYGDEVPEGPCL